IRKRVEDLLTEQRRRMNSFDGLIGRSAPAANGPAAGAPRKPGQPASQSEAKPGGRKLSLTDAILLIWKDGGYSVPLTTEEIAGALPEVGSASRASDRSLKSTMNQA